MDPRDNMQSGEIKRIGKYEIVDVLGRGGMGVVYRGIDRQIGREVAIKTLTQGILGDSNMLARFYEEGRRTGRLKHPNIVTVYDLGDDNGTPYIVMEHVEGDPLDKVLQSGASLSLADRLGVLQEVCSALGYAHRNNVIHRDVKPSNIFVQPDGSAKLIDFGIARLEKRTQDSGLTRTGTLIGTIQYMAPERLLDQPVDGRSDIFAAGVVLYQLIAGQLPFTGVDSVLMQKILNERHPPLSAYCKNCPASLEMIVDRALAKSPDDRYSTAEEMAADLAAAITELRHEQVLELLPEAQRLVQEQEYTRARGVLHQLLKIDGKHAEARAMLSEIQRQYTQRQREERIQQIRQQAEDAINNSQFDRGLSVLESGLELDSANPELVKLREKAQREKEKQDRINEFLQQAESARRRGDYKSALTAAQKALKVDKTNSRIVSLCNILTNEAEEAQKKAQARTLLESARGELGFRRYDEAIELLKQAEQFDPTNPELTMLMGDAHSGLEQLKHKEAIAKIEEEVAQASSHEQLLQVAQSIQEAMAAMPSESALFRLNAQVERQLKEHENRLLVEETVQACRELRPREALDRVRAARLRLPGDERLLSLESMLADRVRQLTVDERRADYLSRAREGLQHGRFSDAVHTLEMCQAEGIATGEILSLLDFARSEEAENRRQEALRANLAHGQALIDDSAFEEAIKFLEGVLEKGDDAAVRLLLDQANAGRDALRRQIDAALSSTVKLAHSGKVAEALQFLQTQPQPVLRSPRVQAALAAMAETRERALFRMVGRAYAVLETDLPAGENILRRSASVSGYPPFFKSIATAFRSRGRAVADRIIAETIGKSKILLKDRDREAAGQLLETVSHTVEFASPELKTEWKRTQKTVSRPSLSSRFGR